MGRLIISHKEHASMSLEMTVEAVMAAIQAIVESGQDSGLISAAKALIASK